MAQTTPVKVHSRGEGSHPVASANENREDFSNGGHPASEDQSGEELHWPSPPNSPGRKPVLKVPKTPPQKVLPERSSTYFDALKGRSATGNLTKSPSDGADVRWFYSKKALKGAILFLTSQLRQADNSFLHMPCLKGFQHCVTMERNILCSRFFSLLRLHIYSLLRLCFQHAYKHTQIKNS
jgi:hypothetical protein